MAYIERKKAEEAIRKYADIKHSNGEPIEYVNGILKSISVINEQPTADVEEVVRCGECEYWKCKREGLLGKYVGDCYNFDFPFVCENRPITRENDFCSYGERRDT